MKHRIVIAAPESDPHAVTLKILEEALGEDGFNVCNLGPCAPTREIADAAEAFRPLIIMISAQNGHALEDLQDLPAQLRKRGVGTIPVLIGGNLSVGSNKDMEHIQQEFAQLRITVGSSIQDARDIAADLARRATTDVVTMR